MKTTRKDFLLGLGGAALGAPLGAWGSRQFVGGSSPRPVAPPPNTPTPPKSPRRDPDPPIVPENGSLSYSQCGEDLIVKFIFVYLGLYTMNYLDIGAHHPTRINNTYLYYTMNFRGVLVEPNPVMCEGLRAVRPEDKVLAAGIGVGTEREADYYMMNESALNTFSREEAEHAVAVSEGRYKIEQVVKAPLLDINEVMDEHFHGAPSFISMDVEGMDLALLKTIDYARFRPKILCVETLVMGTKQSIPETREFMESQGYVVRGETLVNTIFVDSELLRDPPGQAARGARPQAISADLVPRASDGGRLGGPWSSGRIDVDA